MNKRQEQKSRQKVRGNAQSRLLDDKSKEKEKEQEKKRERSRDKSKDSSKSIKQNIDKIFNKNNTEFVNKGLNIITLTDSGIFSQYEEINKKEILTKNTDKIEEVSKIIIENGEKTTKGKAKKLGEELYDLIANMKKTNNKCPFPYLKFNQSLKDEDFINKIKESINYISGKMDNDYISALSQLYQLDNRNDIPFTREDIVNNHY